MIAAKLSSKGEKCLFQSIVLTKYIIITYALSSVPEKFGV